VQVKYHDRMRSEHATYSFIDAPDIKYRRSIVRIVVFNRDDDNIAREQLLIGPHSDTVPAGAKR